VNDLTLLVRNATDGEAEDPVVMAYFRWLLM